MKLISLSIKNFRSIEDATFDFAPVDGGNTYTLIGVNESGKSSFLKAISAVANNEEVIYDKDFSNPDFSVNIALNYQLTPEEEEKLVNKLVELGFDAELLSLVKITSVSVCAKFEPVAGTQKKTIEQISFQKNMFSEYTLQDQKPIKKEPEQTQEDLNLEQYFENNFPNYFGKLAHQIVFWKSESKYLINEQINLTSFADSPDSTSIPLVNCFALAGVSKEYISEQVNKIRDNPAETNNLEERLGDSVTAHIKNVWKNHPIGIKFQINYPSLSFLVEDDKNKYQAKTTAQRSDGFRQFISFLLTISAESATNKLSNTLLLLDEPETHLHPKAQEYLMDELIEITKGNDNNIVLFATHSNHMIDKNHMERCFRVSKEENNKTKLEKIELGKTSYAEVNYEVFGIAGSDYHNELYGYLEADGIFENMPDDKKTKEWVNIKNGKTKPVSLHEYIRHSIHHPENTENDKFTEEQLRESIETLRKLKKAKN